MELLNALTRRVALPGDSETRHAQKSLVILVSLIGAAGAVINAIPLFEGGLGAMGWSYLVSAFNLTVGPLGILLRPRFRNTSDSLDRFRSTGSRSGARIYPRLIQLGTRSGGRTARSEHRHG